MKDVSYKREFSRKNKPKVWNNISSYKAPFSRKLKNLLSNVFAVIQIYFY